jgi:hypothetical protein
LQSIPEDRIESWLTVIDAFEEMSAVVPDSLRGATSELRKSFIRRLMVRMTPAEQRELAREYGID